MPILDDALIASFFDLEEVQAAKRKIDAKKSDGPVYFTVPLTATIKSVLKDSFGLEFPAANTIPMRWIKGDVAPHVDIGSAKFDTTHLMYLTDSPGELILGGKAHPITKGTAYTFPESVRHETIHTGSEPRLLLGPMSEEGFAVGDEPPPPPTTIDGSGGTTVYIRQYGEDYQYRDASSTIWTTFALPTTITNIDTTGLENLTIEFETDMLFDYSNNYFICGSSNIQFGSRFLKGDGTRPVITIDGVEGYPGLIQNGTNSSDGNSDIFIYNLFVDGSGSTLADNAGWIGQEYFGKAAFRNYIVNCSSAGPISGSGGGIVGRRSGSEAGASLTLLGCSSSGVIANNAGGLVGRNAGNNAGSIRCVSCWSTGEIGTAAGGILGSYAVNVTIENCYSMGNISIGGGGIAGVDFYDSTITNCYSTGPIIGAGAGGIVGNDASGTIISNCYSLGEVTDITGGGIVGSASINCTVENCYTVGDVSGDVGYIISGSADIPATCFSEDASGTAGKWDSMHTIDILLGRPNPIVGEFWVDVSSGSPYELANMGYTPYDRENIIEVEGVYKLNNVVASSVAVGSATAGAIVAGKAYTLLDITEGDAGSYSSIRINPTTGVISTTAATVPGLYGIALRNNGSYNITGYLLTITEAPPAPTPSDSVPCCARPTFRRGPLIDNATLTALAAGNTYIGSVRQGGTNISYAQLMAMKKAKASKQ